MIRSSGRSWRTHSSGGRGMGRRRPVSGSFRKRRLFQTQVPAYFSLRRMIRTEEVAHPRRAGPRLVSLPGKGIPSRLSAWAMPCILWPWAYSLKMRRMISASVGSISYRAGAVRWAGSDSIGAGMAR